MRHDQATVYYERDGTLSHLLAVDPVTREAFEEIKDGYMYEQAQRTMARRLKEGGIPKTSIRWVPRKIAIVLPHLTYFNEDDMIVTLDGTIHRFKGAVNKAGPERAKRSEERSMMKITAAEKAAIRKYWSYFRLRFRADGSVETQEPSGGSWELLYTPEATAAHVKEIRKQKAAQARRV